MRKDIFNVFYATFGTQGLAYYFLIHGPQLTRQDCDQATKDWNRYLTELQGNLQDLERLQAT